MKTLKVICTAMVLTLVLSLPAYAGDISTPGITTNGPITSQPEEPGDNSSPELTLATSSQSFSPDFFELLLTLVF